MHAILHFLAGMLVCNAIPHLAAGTRGEPFPTPFAKPRGVGLSPPVVNVIWGWFNLLAGAWLARTGVAQGGPRVMGGVAFSLGFLLIGVFTARHFGKVRLERERQQSLPAAAPARSIELPEKFSGEK